MINNNFKIAVVSDNGSTVSRHFGSAPFYEVFTIENGQIKNREKREKFNAHAPGMHHQHNQHGGINAGGNGNGGIMGSGNGQGMMHGNDQGSENKHNSMIQNISDCECLISRGMGYGIYQHLENANIKPIITDIRMIEDAVKAVIDGTIVDHSELLH